VNGLVGSDLDGSTVCWSASDGTRWPPTTSWAFVGSGCTSRFREKRLSANPLFPGPEEWHDRVLFRQDRLVGACVGTSEVALAQKAGVAGCASRQVSGFGWTIVWESMGFRVRSMECWRGRPGADRCRWRVKRTMRLACENRLRTVLSELRIYPSA